MTVICVDVKRWDLWRLKSQVRRFVTEAVIYGCRSPDKAYELAREKGCDVLLTEIDLLSVQYDGFILAGKIKSLNPRVNIIFVTARTDIISPRRAFQIPASGYIVKPCLPEKIEDQFANLRFAAS